MVIPLTQDTRKKHTYISSEVPSTEEIDNIKKARTRVILVIKTRWVILGILLLYGLYATFFYTLEGLSELSPIEKAVPVAAFIIAVAYNAFCHYAYRWFLNIRYLNLIQIMIDLVFVTIIVHFSGGVVSWFWVIYFVLIVEAVFLGERIYDVWTVGIGASILYGCLLTAEFSGIIPSVQMPFVNNLLQQNFQYGMIKWAWVSVVCLSVSGIGYYMMRELRGEEEKLRKMNIVDHLTGLYNGWHFDIRLNSEIQRAKRYGRIFSLLILDVDDFKKLNDTYGYETGDNLLAGVAELIKKNIRRSDSTRKYDIDIPCRVEGGRFAVILPEASSVQAGVIAERLRTGIESCDFEGKSATVSAAIASFPDHGTDMNSLKKAASDAMFLAKKKGKNRVILANA